MAVEAAKEAPRRRRSGGRAGKAQEQAAAAANPVPRYRQLRNPYPPIEVFSADQIEAIQQASLTILKEMGIRVLLPEARDLLRQAGADVDEDTQMVRFEPELVEESVAKAPTRFTFFSRNPDCNVDVGEDAVCFATVGGPPNCSDLEQGRRPGTLEDFKNFMRLAQAYDVIHTVAPAVEPLDVPVNLRQLHMMSSLVEVTEKIPFAYARGREALADAIEIIRIVRGITKEQMLVEPSMYTVVNANSPLQLDVPMSLGVIDMARAGQGMVLTPFTLAGAMAPITLPGALAQQNAEALAGLALSQIVKPGAPVIYGGFTSNVDMKSGAPAFGTPEYTKAALAGGQLARRNGVPYRSSNVNASNAPDVQSAYESQMSIWGALMGGCNLLLHGAGWLEGGLTASYEKIHHRRGNAADDGRILRTLRSIIRYLGPGCGPRSWPRRTLFRGGTHAGTL